MWQQIDKACELINCVLNRMVYVLSRTRTRDFIACTMMIIILSMESCSATSIFIAQFDDYLLSL